MEGKERSIRQMTERSAPGLPKKGLWEGTGGAEPSLHWPGRGVGVRMKLLSSPPAA